MRILFVENHPVFAAIAVRQFLVGHEVVIAASLAEGRAALRGARFDAALVDFDLDDGKGDTFVEHLRSERFAGHIIAISSHEVGNRALLAAGAHAACPKARFSQLRAMLEGVL